MSCWLIPLHISLLSLKFTIFINLSIIVLLYTERKKWKSCFCFFTDGKQPKVRELDMITCDLEGPWHDYCIICRDDVTGGDFENSLYTFDESEKRYWIQCIIMYVISLRLEYWWTGTGKTCTVFVNQHKGGEGSKN